MNNLTINIMTHLERKSSRQFCITPTKYDIFETEAIPVRSVHPETGGRDAGLLFELLAKMVDIRIPQ